MFHVEPRRQRRAVFHVEHPVFSIMLHCSIFLVSDSTVRQSAALFGRTPMISLARYATLLAHRDFKSVLVASIVGRLPIGVTGLSILLLAQGATGSFARGGTAAAAYVVGLACFAPILGRIIDRSGPRSVRGGCSIAFPVSLIALVAAVRGDADGVLLPLAAAFAAGANFPPITVCMRTFFRRRLAEEHLLATAYSLESVLIETIFIVGPVLVAFFVAYVSASAAVLFAAFCAITGTLLFLRSPALRSW